MSCSAWDFSVCPNKVPPFVEIILKFPTVLLFVFWYCHKRGRETRLEREAKVDSEGRVIELDDDPMIGGTSTPNRRPNSSRRSTERERRSASSREHSERRPTSSRKRSSDHRRKSGDRVREEQR
jgi:hypothetical protein